MAWRCLAAVAALLLFPLSALAQNGGVQQGGSVIVPGHIVAWVHNGMIGDPGGAAGVASGSGQQPITDLGITASGMPFCINDAYTNAAGGYHQFCVGANSTIAGLQGAFLSENAYGGAAPLPLVFNVNGSNYQFPFTTNGAVGPTSTAIGDCATWSNAVGTLLAAIPCTPYAPMFCPAIEKFGGSGNGTTDNAPALNALIAAQPTGQACATFGAGTYLFNSAIAATVPIGGGLSINGVGKGQTFLYFPTSNGFNPLLPAGPASFNLSNLTMQTGSPGNGYIGVNLQGSGNYPTTVNLTNVEFRGFDGAGQTDYWSVGVSAHLSSWVTFTNVSYWGSSGRQGIGAILSGNASTATFGIVFDFVAPNFNSCQYGVETMSYAQGVNITNGNFTGCTKGVYIPSGQVGISQLTVNGVQFGTVTNEVGIEDDSGAGDFLFNNFFVFNSSTGPQNGIWLSNTNECVVLGNQFGWGNTPTDTVGITVVNNNSGAPCTIGDNSFWNLPTGIVLEGGTSNVNVEMTNFYTGTTTNLVNQGTNNSLGSISPYGGGLAYASTGINVVAPPGGSVGLFAGSAMLMSITSSEFSVNGNSAITHNVTVSGCTMDFDFGLLTSTAGC